MNAILKKICEIRGERDLAIDDNNQNRYRIIVRELNGSKSAYYFGVPIYQAASGKLLDMKYQQQNEKVMLYGSNSKIILSDQIVLADSYNTYSIIMLDGFCYRNDTCCMYNDVEVSPTVNGLLFRVDLSKERIFSFRLKSEIPFCQIRNNGKYFALMRGKFTPYLTISMIGVMSNNCVIGPAKIQYQKRNDCEYDLTVLALTERGTSVWFEMNVQEEKLFQDTTVESKHPKVNNAYGGTAFVGNCDAFGEQWLYMRPNFTVLNDLFGVYINDVELYLPSLNRSETHLSAHPLAARFCSFGSNWENKIMQTMIAVCSEPTDGYHKFNLKNILVQNQRLHTMSEGWILKSAHKGNGFSVVSTGDSYFAPQILKINYQ